MCKLVKWFNSKDCQEPGSKQILTQNSLVKSTQQRILNSRKFEFSFYAVAAGMWKRKRKLEAEAEAGSGSGGSGKFLWKRKRKLEAVNGYCFRFHLRCSTILALNVFLTQNKQLKHTITRVCEASCCRKYPLSNSQKFESTAVC